MLAVLVTKLAISKGVPRMRTCAKLREKPVGRVLPGSWTLLFGAYHVLEGDAEGEACEVEGDTGIMF